MKSSDMLATRRGFVGSQSLFGHSKRDENPWRMVLLGPLCLAGLVICLLCIRMGYLPAPLAVAFPLAGLAFLGLFKLHYLFFATVLLLPFESLMVPEFPLNVQLAFVLATTGLVIGIVKSSSLPRTPVDHLFLAYLGLLVVSILQTYLFSGLEPPQLLPAELGWQASPYRGWYHLVAVIIGMAVVYFVVRNVTSSARLKATAVCLLSISLAVAFFSFYEAIAKVMGLPLVYFSFRDQEYVSLARYPIVGLAIPRVYGSAGEPLSFGNFLIVPFSLSIAFLLSRLRSRRYGIIFYATLTSLTLAILLTFSTSAWFGAIVSLCVLLLLVPSRKVSQIAIPLFLLAILVIFLSPLGSQEAVQSVSESQQRKIQAALGGDTRDFRYVGLKRSLSVIERFPVLGVGLGNEPFWMESANMNIGSYNILLSLFVETGALGCFLFLWLIMKLVRLFLAAHRRATDPEHGAISLGCAAALIGCLASHMAWGGRLTSWEWFVIGLGLAAYNVIEREQREANPDPIHSNVIPKHNASRWQMVGPRYAQGNTGPASRSLPLSQRVSFKPF